MLLLSFQEERITIGFPKEDVRARIAAFGEERVPVDFTPSLQACRIFGTAD